MNDHSRRSSRSSLRALDLALQFNSLGRHPALGPASLCLRLRPLQPPHIWNLQFKKKIILVVSYNTHPVMRSQQRRKEEASSSLLDHFPPLFTAPSHRTITDTDINIKTINHQHRPTRERRSRREKKKKSCSDLVRGLGHHRIRTLRRTENGRMGVAATDRVRRTSIPKRKFSCVHVHVAYFLHFLNAARAAQRSARSNLHTLVNYCSAMQCSVRPVGRRISSDLSSCAVMPPKSK